MTYCYTCPEGHDRTYRRPDLAGSMCVDCLRPMRRDWRSEAVGVNIANLKEARA